MRTQKLHPQKLSRRERENIERYERERAERDSSRPTLLDQAWERERAKSLLRRPPVTCDPLVRRDGLSPRDPGNPEERVRRRTNGSHVTEDWQTRVSERERELVERARVLVRRLVGGAGLEKRYWWSQYWALVGLLEELMPEPEYCQEERQRALKKSLYGSDEWKRRDGQRTLERNRRRRKEPKRKQGEDEALFAARLQRWADRRERHAELEGKRRAGRTDEQRQRDSDKAKLRVQKWRERERTLRDASKTSAAGGRAVPERPPEEVLALRRVDGAGRALRPGVAGAAGQGVQGARPPDVPPGPADVARRDPPDDDLLDW